MTLKLLRESMGLSQFELDRRAKLTKGTTHDIEAGKNANPSIDVCLAIVDAFRAAGAKGADVETIFGQGARS